MSRFLNALLGTEESLFSTGLARLEKTTGHGGVDTRLIADIIEKSHTVMRQLGLDTSDTTGRELYFALNEAVKRGDGEWLLVDTDYVLMSIDGTVISFNLIDIIENMHHSLPYKRQIISHGQRSLRGELVKRYIDHVRTDEVTTREIASLIGLLPESDKWYTDGKYRKKQTVKHSKEIVK
jgi:hypothetical protein